MHFHQVDFIFCLPGKNDPVQHVQYDVFTVEAISQMTTDNLKVVPVLKLNDTCSVIMIKSFKRPSRWKISYILRKYPHAAVGLSN